MNAITLSIGDELVLGQTVDTNSAWLSGELAALGFNVIAHITVGDSQEAIVSAIADAAERCDLLLVTGGLGPTKDDLTRQALAQVLNQPLEMHDSWLRQMEKMFQRLGRVMVESNRVQAMIPRGARLLPNTKGTAAGIDADWRSCRIFSMPGVPVEMRAMFQLAVAPVLSTAGGGLVIRSRSLHTFGVGESAIGEMLGDLMNRAGNPSVGTTVSGGGVSLRITSRQPTVSMAEETLAQTVAECRAVLGDLIYGSDTDSLPSIVAKLLTQGPVRRITTAESCTGGLLAKMLTDIPGSSQYFHRGWITYCDQAKSEMLGVPPGLISQFGAVSEPVVSAMADGARSRSKADFALAISGIAGPDGGTAEKPVGTVCIALAHPAGITARTFRFPGDREMVRDRSAKMALTLLRYQLIDRMLPL
jgi:nicotinamide-nucleotide amidase